MRTRQGQADTSPQFSLPVPLFHPFLTVDFGRLHFFSYLTLWTSSEHVYVCVTVCVNVCVCLCLAQFYRHWMVLTAWVSLFMFQMPLHTHLASGSCSPTIE